MGTSLNMCCVVCTEKSLICYSSRNNNLTREGELSATNLSLREERKSKLQNEQGTNIQSKPLFLTASIGSDINYEKDKSVLSLAPLLTSKIGLYNPGNSCFMYSNLQILIHCFPFIQAFEKQVIVKENIISTAFRDLLIKIITCTSIKYFPHPFIKTFFEVNKSFRGHKQHDCQDFLSTLLENINVELNQIKSKVPYQELNQTGKKAILYKEYISYFNKREKSIITDVFYWNDLSIRRCSCGHQTHIFSQKTDLPLNLLKENVNPHVTQLIKEKYAQVVNEECLVTCKHCNQKQNCQLISSVCSLPKVLILSLQRNNGEDSQKNKVGVEFEDEMDFGDIVDKDIFEKGSETKFILYGLVLHIGIIERGHYITNIKMKDQWIMFDDDKIETFPSDNKSNNKYKSSDVYCLFYLRKDSTL